ncbi:hypothetical protein [Acetobacter oryzifermentans]|uniref:hypothetical protein n=1 Tax=Acetobacter oryzifermentans TaxID=1633874 RepID=UPI0012FF1803|nr:hypothetical protein [Acetobacter oryzifermentans]
MMDVMKVATQTKLLVVHDDLSPQDLCDKLRSVGVEIIQYEMYPITRKDIFICKNGGEA